MLTKPLILWVIRHKRDLFLVGKGDLGEWSGVFSTADRAVEALLDYDREHTGLFEIVELREVTT